MGIERLWVGKRLGGDGSIRHFDALERNFVTKNFHTRVGDVRSWATTSEEISSPKSCNV